MDPPPCRQDDQSRYFLATPRTMLRDCTERHMSLPTVSVLCGDPVRLAVVTAYGTDRRPVAGGLPATSRCPSLEDPACQSSGDVWRPDRQGLLHPLTRPTVDRNTPTTFTQREWQTTVPTTLYYIVPLSVLYRTKTSVPRVLFDTNTSTISSRVQVHTRAQL